MNQDWEIKDFEDCLDKLPSSKKIPRKKFLTSGKYPIISQEKTDINGYWDDPEDLLCIERPVVIFGDHTKILKYIDFDFVKGADGVKVFLPKKNINPLFFFYQLKSISLDDLGYARHYRLLKKIQIKFPSIEEQKKIVAKLDQTFAAIDTAKINVEKNLENAKELFQSKLNEIFSQKGEGWDENKLCDVCEINPPKKESKLKLEDEDLVSFVPMKNLGVLKQDLILKENRALDSVYSSYTYFADNDVLLAKITPCFENGKIGIAKNLKNGVGFGSSEFVVYRPNESIESEFLFYFLCRDKFRKYGVKVMTGAVGHKRIPKEFISDQLIELQL